MATIVTGVGSPGTVGSASGGRTYAYNAITSTGNTVVAPANPARQKLTFYNPGLVDLYVSMIVYQPAGSDVPLIPQPGQLGGCFVVYANGGTFSIIGECQKPWQAFAASGTANPLTVIDSNV